MMKFSSTLPNTLAILFLISSVPAQTTAVATKATAPSSYALVRYDPAEEVTLHGTVSSVLTKAAPSMIAGSHLLFATPAGPVDASLGRLGLQGYGAVSVAAGQQIEATGVMKTIKDQPIFLVRILKVGGEIYTIRNQRGLLLSPQARQRAAQKTSPNGEAQ
jgi:hypothetical protein